MGAEYRLIVGLGNPTKEYCKTRHNAGFWFIDALCLEYNLTLKDDNKFGGKIAVWDRFGANIYVLQPMQYMNRSGSAVKKVAEYFKIGTEKLLVAHDDVDFEPGVVRLKVGGGHGGHNGLRDIMNQLGRNNFARIRIGIGCPLDRSLINNFVLGQPAAQEAEKIKNGIAGVIGVMPTILGTGVGSAMNELHRKA